jgi:amino acid adenylation domain-containing protein
VAATAAAHQAGAAAVLLACWQLMHARLAGAAEVLIGVVPDGRKYEELQGAIGPFAEALPMRAEVDEALRFVDLLRLTDDGLRAAVAWQEYFSVDRVPAAGSWWLPIQFEFAGAAVSPIVVDGVEGQLEIRQARTDRFDTRLRVTRTAAGLRVELHYDAATRSRAAARLLLQRYAGVVCQAIAAPEHDVRQFTVTTESERAELVVAFNATAAALAIDALPVHELFEARVARHPDLPALACDGTTLTYRQLNDRANRIARHLRQHGIGRERIVALCLERSLDMVAGMLGILKSGAAYLPIDPGYPPERVSLLLADAGAAAMVTADRHRHLAGDRPVVLVDGWASGPEPGEYDDPHVAVDTGDLAYVIYTSGSTGQPKAVAIEHRQLRNYVGAIARVLGLPDGSRYATVSTFSADLGHTAVFPSLLCGGCLHVLTEQAIGDAHRFTAYMQAEQIDCLKIVPSHFRALTSGIDAAAAMPRRCLVLGGEASSWDWIERIQALAPECRILNHYGPTETTVGATTCELSRNTDRSSAIAPLGRPLANSRAYILDGAGRPVPGGVVGELYLGGAGVGRGYLGRPALTAERFVPDAFADTPGSRLYRTGDLARFGPAGDIVFVGRRDAQVKLRGYRVELGEVEATLAGAAAVRDVAAAAREDGRGDLQLVAYVVARRGSQIDVAALR